MMNNIVTILVTDGDNRSSLAVTRSLGKYNYRIIVTGKERNSISSKSRYCTNFHMITPPDISIKKFIHEISIIILKENVDIIIPMTESTVISLLSNKKFLPKKVVIATDSLDKANIITNKYRIFRIATELGIPMPRTCFIENKEDYERCRDAFNSFPVVVKPSMSQVNVGDNYKKTNVKYANSAKELETYYKNEIIFNSYPFIIQEKIIGQGTGLFTLFDTNRHLALFSHTRELEKPPSGGVSVICRSEYLDENMVNNAQLLLSRIGWKGVAMVEFKRDQRDGQAKLIEINGRFWGSLQLAIESGVDFPVLLLKYLQGSPFNCNDDNDYIVGMRMKWLLGILDHLLIRLRNRKSALNLPPNIQSYSSILLDLILFKKNNTVYDVLDFHDIQPFKKELSDYFAVLFDKKSD